jgi:hypothetical protein
MTTEWRLARTVGPAMTVEHLTVTISSAASGAVATGVAVLAGIFALQFGILFVLRRILGPGGDEGEEPGSDGGGRGRRRDPAPRRPPPDGLVCWPEFERQFADHVAGLRRSPGRRFAADRRSPGSDDALPGDGPDHDANQVQRRSHGQAHVLLCRRLRQQR